MVENIKAVLIFEMLGRPAEHLKSTLSQFVDKIPEEEGVELVSKKIHEPKKVEQAQQELFTTFAETEINFKDINSLLKIVFVCMPSHIEIISPTNLNIKNFEISTLMTELARKLHQYDEIAKGLIVERNILLKQLQELGVQPAIPSPAPAQPQEIKKEKSKKKGKVGKETKDKKRKRKKEK